MKRCIFVLGMHRSGTSAAAGFLQLLGVDLGEKLLKPAPDNPKGFFESQTMVALNYYLTLQLGRDFGSEDYLPQGWLELPVTHYCEKILKKFVELEFGSAKLFALKDPRFSHLYPLWEKAFNEMGIKRDIVIMIRHPSEVAASLAVRDGFSLEKCLHLFIQNLLEAERHSRGKRRMVLSYDQLLQDWSKVAIAMENRFKISFPNTLAGAEENMNRFLTPELRHHRQTVTSLPTEKKIKELLSLAEYIYETFEIVQCGSGEIDTDIVDNILYLYNFYHKPLAAN